MKSNKIFSIALSVFVSFVFVFAVTYAATTISTNINTGGTLTVSDTSTLTGAVTMSSTLGVTGKTTLVNASSTMLTVSGNTYLATTTLTSGSRLILGTLASDPTGDTEGSVYYNSGSKVIKLYDGSNWFTVGTTTSGLTLSGSRLQLADLNYYTTFGTTTQSGLSVLTLEATSTASIPLTLRGYTGQIADLFRIHNVAGTELFAIDASGNASTSVISTTGSLFVNGNATTTPAGTLTLKGSLGVASSSPYVALGVTGTTTASAGMVIGNIGTPINALLFGTCTVNPNDGFVDSTGATTTTCTATGVRSGDVISITPANLPGGAFLISASSTGTDTIQVSIGVATSTNPSLTTYAGWSWIAVR